MDNSKHSTFMCYLAFLNDILIEHVHSVLSATPGGILDRGIEAEEEQYKDFLRLVCSCFLALGQVNELFSLILVYKNMTK